MALAIADVTPLVVAAGLTVTAGVATVATARLSLFSDLAPGLAITVAVTLAVAVTFTPALMAVLGRFLYWPSHPGPAWARRPLESSDCDSVPRRLNRVLVRRPVGLLLIGVVAWGSYTAIDHLGSASIGLNLVSDLPVTSPAAIAAHAAGDGFAPGISSPNVIVLHQSNIVKKLPQLDRLQRLLVSQAGIAGVLGPATSISTTTNGLFVSRDGDYARYLLVLSHPPYQAVAVAELRHLEQTMPAMPATAGIRNTTVTYAGDTAVAADVSRTVFSDLMRVGGLAVLVNVAFLLIFLRSVVASLLLGLASALVVLVALSVTAWAGGRSGVSTSSFTFFVPVGVEVLLISFGSDYNLFLVGRIWTLGRSRPLRQAIVQASSSSSGPIDIAGFTLAGSFAMLAIVPLASFRQFALAMLAGLLIDTFIVRSLLVPAALSLIGRVGTWPAHMDEKSLPMPATPPEIYPR